MGEDEIQRTIVQALNEAFPEPWSAFAATTRDNIELVEMENEETKERFVISVQKGY